VQAAEHDRCGNDEFPPGRREFPRRFALRIVDLLQNATSRCDIADAGICQRQLARGPGQQASAEQGFQVGYLAAERCERHLQGAARRRKAAFLRDRHQHRHGFQAVHRSFHYSVKSLPIISGYLD
jgi:hypothetical protein